MSGSRWGLRSLLVSIGVVLIVSLAVASASSANQTRSTKKTQATTTIQLKIGDVVGLTGPLAPFGPSFHKAAAMAVRDATVAAKAVGLDLKIKLSEADEGTGPTMAVSSARQLATGGLGCLLGGTSTTDSIAMAKAVSIPAGIAQLSPTASSPLWDSIHSQKGLTFATGSSDTFAAKALAVYMASTLGGAKGKLVAVGGRNDSYGGPATAAFTAAWKALGGTVTGPVLYDPNASSYDSEAALLVANNPVAFVIEDFPETYAKVGAALLRTGKFSASKLYTTSGFPADVPASIPPDALNLAWVVQPGQPSTGVTVKAYNKAYAAFHMKPAAQQPFNTYNYDSAMLCILSAVAAKSGKGADVAKKVIAVSGPSGRKVTFLQLKQAFRDLLAGKDIDYQGVSGGIDMNSAGRATSGIITVSQYQNNKLVLLKQYGFVGGKLVPAK